MLPILHQSYWRDEAYSVLLSLKSPIEIFALTFKDTHPSLYYWLLHYWMKFFGDAEYITRSFSFLSHILLVIVSFILLKHLVKNWKVALLGSTAVLLNPFLINYAFETRTYAFFALLITTSAYLYLRKKRFLTSIVLALIMLTHNFGVFFLLGYIVYWLVNNKSTLKSKLSDGTMYFALPVITLLGWTTVLWNEWMKVAEGFWIEPVTSSVFIETFRTFFQGSADYPTKGMVYNLSLILVFLGFTYWIVRKNSKPSINDRVSLLSYLVFLPTLLVFLISYFWVPIYLQRYLLGVLPLLIVLVSYSLFKLSKLRPAFSNIVFALSVAYILFSVQGTEEILRTTTKPALNYGVQQIVSKAQEGDIVIPETNLNFLETKYYINKSGSNIQYYAYAPSGKIVFYIGSVLFETEEILVDYPEDKRIWTLTPNGGHYLNEVDLEDTTPTAE